MCNFLKINGMIASCQPRKKSKTICRKKIKLKSVCKWLNFSLKKFIFFAEFNFRVCKYTIKRVISGFIQFWTLSYRYLLNKFKKDGFRRRLYALDFIEFKIQDTEVDFFDEDGFRVKWGPAKDSYKHVAMRFYFYQIHSKKVSTFYIISGSGILHDITQNRP